MSASSFAENPSTAFPPQTTLQGIRIEGRVFKDISECVCVCVCVCVCEMR